MTLKHTPIESVHSTQVTTYRQVEIKLLTLVDEYNKSVGVLKHFEKVLNDKIDCNLHQQVRCQASVLSFA